MAVDLYCILTPTVKRQGRPQFVPLQSLQAYSGFRSVYAFRATERDEIVANGSLRRIQHLPVVAVELLVDFDDHQLAAQQFQELLQDNGHAFNCYDSGNRSRHFHVMTSWLEGTWVPYAQREWVRRYAPQADDTIYKHSGLFRLPGTWHEKRSGHRKRLLISHGGTPLVIPRLEPKLQAVPLQTFVPEEAKQKLTRGLQKVQHAGGRRVHAWYLGAMAHDSGLTLDESIDLVLEWNQAHAIPSLEPDVIITKLEEAYLSRSLNP